MRIVGGALRGRAIAAPKGDLVRPTGDRTREALFNILAHADFDGFTLEAARVLDLFAGSGALGIEAISRGASFALFVEEHAESRACIRENLESLSLNGNAKIYKRDATRLGPRPGSVGPAFNLLFADPPYGKGLGGAALLSAREGGWLTEDALCVVEESALADFEAPEGFEEVDRRRYRDTEIIFMRPR
ncbi:16S rRNA (guanine(966)-N(2))-methyltransferase RsmD [Parvibaculum sp.]|jgi:16S rRNA (guanine966-N2)-methyltransferase|uniref:16S rRNA (guanine(966)-N(2))-methyltransferase RsmD n=1 Tax=Parvibaculum sp. TaxID=2024848 RepID=UPI002A27CC24|nr:16S rRNA (guanine(966)-N(2))-methyltransferase RsmD [Parvibaculum sp.]